MKIMLIRALSPTSLGQIWVSYSLTFDDLGQIKGKIINNKYRETSWGSTQLKLDVTSIFCTFSLSRFGFVELFCVLLSFVCLIE